MSDGFQYVCPTCGTKNILHEEGCKYDYTDLQEFEKPYIDLLSVLTAHAAELQMFKAHPVISKEKLVEEVEKLHDQNPWLEKHNDCLSRLIEENRVIWDHGGLKLTTSEERVERIVPTFEPLQTIYEYGPVDGAKDYAVYTMVSWCALKEMSWRQTKNFVKEWLRETGSWEREDWSESSPESLVRDKKHVWSNDLGWGDMANAAKNEIESQNPPKGIDVSDKIDKTLEDYD